MHARIEDGLVVEYPILNLRSRFPNASLPEDLTNDDALPPWFVYVHASEPPMHDQTTQKLVPGRPVNVGGKWQAGWLVQPLSDEEKAEMFTAYANTVRSTRNKLLAESDWTQVSDAPTDKQAWAQYRQALRDVTSQVDFPFSVTWPPVPV